MVFCWKKCNSRVNLTKHTIAIPLYISARKLPFFYFIFMQRHVPRQKFQHTNTHSYTLTHTVFTYLNKINETFILLLIQFSSHYVNQSIAVIRIISSSPDSLNADRSDKSNAISPSPGSLYKLVVPLLRCEVVDVRDAAVNALGMINHDAFK